MARDSDNALVLSDAFAYYAPVGTDLPTDVTTPLTDDWLDTGWLTDTGLGESKNTSATKKYAVNGALMRSVKASDERNFTFEGYETNANVLALTRPGSSVSTTSGLTTTHVQPFVGTQLYAWVLEYHYGDTLTVRKCVPEGEATVSDAIQDAYTDITTYKFNLDCYPDGSNDYYVELSNIPAVEVS